MALKKSQKSLKKWTKQDWTTSDGKPSKGKKRYLPKKPHGNRLQPQKKPLRIEPRPRQTRQASNLANN